MWRTPSPRQTDQSAEGLYTAAASYHSSSSSSSRTVFQALRNRFPYEGFLQACAVLLAMLVVYGALLAAIGPDARLPGSVWTVCVVWICAQAAGFLVCKIGLPPVVGMVGIGLLLRNIPGGVLRNLPFMWSVKLRFAGLVLVLLQSGLTSPTEVSDSAGQLPVLALALLPLTAEAVALGLCLGLWLKLHVFMAIAGAMILAAVCPVITGAAMHAWQGCRLGTRKGIPMWLVSAARWNAFFAIAGFSIFLGLAVPHQDLGMQIAHGPLSIVIGVAAGILLGFVCALTPVWSSPLSRAAALLVMGELMAFCGVTWHFPAAGFMGILGMSGLTSLIWQRSSHSSLCDQIAPGASKRSSEEVRAVLEVVWAVAVQPLVMGLAGASIHFDTLPSGVALKALAVAAIGLFTRACAAMMTLMACKAEWGESIAMALVWVSGGSIQATLAAAPLELAYVYKSDAHHYTAWAEAITVVGVYSILIGATIAWLSAAFLGPVLLTKEEEELPMVAQPGSPEPNENNPFLSGLQQSGISITGNRNKDLPMQLLHKTESVEVRGRHGNPFSDDGSNEERHDKSPLLIGSADSSYNMDTPRRMASHNPFTAPARNGDYHTLRSIRRITSGESAGSPLGPKRSSQSVPALVRPASHATNADSHDEHLTVEDRQRISESFLWENEPMSAAAMLGGHHTDLGRSFSTRRTTSSNASFNAGTDLDAASCLWENEPMSAAASMPFKVGPRLSLDRVSEVSEALTDGTERPGSSDPAKIEVPRLAIQTRRHSVTSTQSGVPVWRPHRPAPPPPPQRANSFPNHRQNEDYLEYEVTSSLTLKETPRSQRKHDLQRELWESQSRTADSTKLASVVAHHHRTPDQLRVSFAPSLSPLQASDPAAVLASPGEKMLVPVGQPDLLAVSSNFAEGAQDSPVLKPLLSAELETRQPPMAFVEEPVGLLGSGAAEGQLAHHSSFEETPLMSRRASAVTLYESAHSGALSEGTDSIAHEGNA
ncbi:hypothetical protein WJX79_009541 [Trebouxia sp. C0005]